MSAAAPPDPSKPYLFIDGEWLLIMVDDDETVSVESELGTKTLDEDELLALAQKVVARHERNQALSFAMKVLAEKHGAHDQSTHGRRGGGGGGGGGPTLTKEDYDTPAYDPKNDPPATPFDTVAVVKAREWAANWRHTNLTNQTVRPDGTLDKNQRVVYNGERMRRGKMHTRIKNEVEIESARQSNGVVAQNKVATIIVGPPAAGKSTVANPLARDTKSRIIDADDVKAKLPEFANGFNAGGVHEESSLLNNQLFDRSMRRGDNMIIPIVGDDAARVQSKYIQKLQDAGYTVNIQLVHADRAVTTQSIVDRFRRGEQVGGQTIHRFVDPSRPYHSVGNKPRDAYYKLQGPPPLANGSFKAHERTSEGEGGGYVIMP